MNANKVITKKSTDGNAQKAKPSLTGTSAGYLLQTEFQIPSRWKRHYRHLLALREHFERERRDHALTAGQPLETFSGHMADAATDEFDHNLSLANLSAEQDVLYEIEQALNRIANGTYGICEVTGKLIPEARLNAIPWTRFTSAIERELEQIADDYPVHLGRLRSTAGSPELTQDVPGEEPPEVIPCDERLHLLENDFGLNGHPVGKNGVSTDPADLHRAQRQA